MSIDALLELIGLHFSSSEGQVLVRCFHTDPLLQQFVQDEEKSLSYLETAPKELVAFSPGKLALWMIAEKYATPLEDLEINISKLPENINKKVSQTYETTLNTLIPPADLLSAGLLALSLHEKRRVKGNWEGIAEEIFFNRNLKSVQKNYLVWRTAFACLFHYCDDFNLLIDEFIHSKSSTVIKSSIPIFIHAFLTNPLLPHDQFKNLLSLAQNLSTDLQLNCLKYLNTCHRSDLSKKLSENLMQSSRNINTFSQIFAELEAFENDDHLSDPLDKQVRYTLPEDINRLAAFYYYKGDDQKACETYQKSDLLLDFIKTQSLYQSYISNPAQVTPSQWLEILNSVPNAKQARHYYIQALITDNKLDDATEQLQHLPSTGKKEYLEKKIQFLTNKVLSPIAYITFDHHNLENSLLDVSYLVHKTKSDPIIEILEFVKSLEQPNITINWMDKILKERMNDLQVVKLARDILVKDHYIEKAIELSSYLEKVDPDESEHKRSLAHLYTLAKRWKQAFSLLQAIIKSETSPLVEDLEKFALSALRTEHIDMAISICHNILQKNDRSVKALVILGEAYFSKGDTAKAIQHMEQVVAMISEEAETWLTLANIWQSKGQTDRCFDVLHKGNRAIPNNPKLLRALGKTYLDKSAPSDAISHLRKAYEIEPDHIEGKLNLAHAEHLLGHDETAYHLLKRHIKDYGNKPEVAKLLGHIFLAMNDSAAAEQALVCAAEHYPEDLETVLAATRLVLDRLESSIDEEPDNELEKIKNILRKAIKITDEDFFIRLHLGDTDRLQGHHQEALNTYKTLSEEVLEDHSQDSWRIFYGLGQSAFALGDKEIGLAALREAASKQPENLTVLHALVEAFQSIDLSEKAHDLAKSALKLAPQDLLNIQWYAQFKMNTNEPGEAVKALKEALQIDPENTALKVWLAKALVSAKSLDEAKTLIEQVISGASSHPEQLHQVANICVHLQDLDLAVLALEKASLLVSDINPLIQMELAVCYKLLDQRKKALQSLNLEDSILTKYPQLVLLKSDLLSDLGQYELALDQLKSIENYIADTIEKATRAFETKTPSPLLYTYDFTYKGYLYRLGQLSRSLGEFKAAQTYLSSASAQDPADATIYNATLESYMVTFDFNKALELGSAFNASERLNDGFDKDIIELVCSQIEMLIYEKDYKQASALMSQIPPSCDAYPRYQALQSQLATYQEKFEKAKDYFVNAQKSYQNHLDRLQTNTLQFTFRKMMILNSLADAAIALDDYQSAQQIHQMIMNLLPNQPLILWRYVLSLVKMAEAQQIADTLFIKNHCPGIDSLSESCHKNAKAAVEKLEGFLSQEERMCIHTRIEAAFTGKWPLKLNYETCLTDPEEAASIIIGSEDEGLVNQIVEAYADDLKVLQAYGVFALRNKVKINTSHIKKALVLDTSNPINHALLAFLEKSYPELAVKSLETALNLWPDEPEWHAIAADMHSKLGNDKDAADHIAFALEIYPQNANFWQKSAEINIRNNHLDHAKADLEKSVSIQSKDPQVWRRIANVNRWMGNLPEAVQNIRVASQLDPDNMDICSQEIKLLIDQKKYSDAELKAEELLQKHNENQILVLLARAQTKQGKFDQAINTLNNALNMAPENMVLALEKIKIKKVREGTEAVLPELIALAQSHSENPEILITLTDWLIQSNRLKKAEEIAQTTLKIVPDQPEVHLMLGRLQRKNGQLDQAISHLSHAITLNPGLVEALIELGKIYQERRDLEEAIDIFKKASQADPSDPRPYYYAGMALKDSKDFVGAEALLKQAKRYSPDDVNIVRQLGVISALNLISNLREAR